MSLQSLDVVIILLFLDMLPCQVVQRRGEKSRFQLQPKFLYQIKGEALILWPQDIHPVGSERFSAVLSARSWSFSCFSVLSCRRNGKVRQAFAAGVFFSAFAILCDLLQTNTPSAWCCHRHLWLLRLCVCDELQRFTWAIKLLLSPFVSSAIRLDRRDFHVRQLCAP